MKNFSYDFSFREIQNGILCNMPNDKSVWFRKEKKNKMKWGHKLKALRTGWNNKGREIQPHISWIDFNVYLDCEYALSHYDPKDIKINPQLGWYDVYVLPFSKQEIWSKSL